MKKILFSFVLIISFLMANNVFSEEQNIKFANIDLIIQNTKIGKEVLNKINELDKENVKKLSTFENELKEKEQEIKLKKNLLSDEELKKEVAKLNIKLADFKKQKNIMVKDLSETKNKELKKFFKVINPIIQNYMDKNSIEILFNSKNIFIGNKNSDLTQILIDEINGKVSG